MGRLGMNRVVSLLVMVCLASTLLTSCYNFPNQLVGPVSIRQAAEGFEASVCRGIEAANLIVEVRTDGEWSRAWVAQGGAQLQPGQLLSARTLDDLFPKFSVLNSDFGDATDISVILTSVAGGENIVAGFDASLIATSDWLHPDGTLTEEPCP